MQKHKTNRGKAAAVEHTQVGEPCYTQDTAKPSPSPSPCPVCPHEGHAEGQGRRQHSEGEHVRQA